MYYALSARIFQIIKIQHKKTKINRDIEKLKVARFGGIMFCATLNTFLLVRVM